MLNGEKERMIHADFKFGSLESPPSRFIDDGARRGGLGALFIKFQKGFVKDP